jgi:hypothetical protein
MQITETKNGKRITHQLDLTQVDQLDDRSGDEQLALVWCETHKTYEWHYVEISELGVN